MIGIVWNSRNASYRIEVVHFLLKCLFYFSFICLHHRGSLYRRGLRNRTCIKRKKSPACLYYNKGVDKWKQSGSLGLIDFFVYNILVLLTLPPFSSIIKKICVAFGSMISVQMGCLLTGWLQSRMKIDSAPAVPLPVLGVSIYLFILDILIPNNFNQCIEQ
jgi:hypothetical protein